MQRDTEVTMVLTGLESKRNIKPCAITRILIGWHDGNTPEAFAELNCVQDVLFLQGELPCDLPSPSPPAEFIATISAISVE